MHACMLSHFCRVQLCATLWTEAHQVSLSTGFSRQEYWSGLPFVHVIRKIVMADLHYIPEADAWKNKYAWPYIPRPYIQAVLMPEFE